MNWLRNNWHLPLQFATVAVLVISFLAHCSPATRQTIIQDAGRVEVCAFPELMHIYECIQAKDAQCIVREAMILLACVRAQPASPPETPLGQLTAPPRYQGIHGGVNGSHA